MRYVKDALTLVLLTGVTWGVLLGDVWLWGHR